MKTFSISQIIESVRIKYDEIGLNESEMITPDEDSRNFDTIVKSNISAAFDFVINGAELSMLEGKSAENLEVTIDENLVGHIDLPTDFLRVITLKLSSWHSSPSKIITEDSPEYRMQSDPYACGTFQQPVIALIHNSKGKQLEFYKAKKADDTLASFVYIPKWTEEKTSVEIPELLSDAFIYYIAALTAATFREDIANDFFKIARSLLKME